MTPTAWAILLATYLMEMGEEPVLPDLFYMGRELIRRNQKPIDHTVLYDKYNNEVDTTYLNDINIINDIYNRTNKKTV